MLFVVRMIGMKPIVLVLVLVILSLLLFPKFLKLLEFFVPIISGEVYPVFIMENQSLSQA